MWIPDEFDLSMGDVITQKHFVSLSEVSAVQDMLVS